MKLIDKDAVVAEIERIKKEECPTDTYEGRCKLLWFEQFSSFLDTLEAKEIGVDLGDPKGDKSAKYIIDTKNLEVKEVDFENYIHGTIDYPIIGSDFPNIYPNYKELKNYCDKNRIMDNDKVRLIMIKEDMP